jgi:hypothetical protein
MFDVEPVERLLAATPSFNRFSKLQVTSQEAPTSLDVVLVLDDRF